MITLVVAGRGTSGGHERTMKKIHVLRLQRTRGQAITEYASIMAFIAIVMLLVFAYTQNTLLGSLSQSFSHTTGQINRLVAAGVRGSI